MSLQNKAVLNQLVKTRSTTEPLSRQLVWTTQSKPEGQTCYINIFSRDAWLCTGPHGDGILSVPGPGWCSLPEQTNSKCSLTDWQQFKLDSNASFYDYGPGLHRGRSALAGLYTVGRPVLHNCPGNISALCLLCQLVVELNQWVNASFSRSSQILFSHNIFPQLPGLGTKEESI